MTTRAVRTGWYVNTVLSRGIGTVVTTGAVGCTRESAVIRLGARPVGGCLMTAITSGSCRQMSR